MAAPVASATLEWTRDLHFKAHAGRTDTIIDGKGQDGPSPIDALAMALAGCMAVDVVDIIVKGRHPLAGLTVALTAERAPEPPRRFLTATLHFVLTGEVPEAAIERALQLSRDKYCSVWQSLRQDIVLRTSFEVRR